MAQTFRQALNAKLASITELTTIVGSAIYPGAVPQTHDYGADGPALTFELPSDARGHVLTGSDGTSAAHVKLTSYAYSKAVTDQMALAIWNAIDGPPGTWGDGTCKIMSVSHQEDSDNDEQPKAATDQWLYIIESEYLIRYRVAIPTL